MIDINLQSAFEKLSLGFVLAAPIGPVSIEMIRRGLNKGGVAAFIVRLGASIGNILCLACAFLGLSHIAKYPVLLNSVSFAGAVFLLYTGIKAIYKKPVTNLVSTMPKEINGIVCGFYLAIANPVSIVFWTGVYAASAGNMEDTSLYNFLFNMLIIVGVLLWGGLLCAFLAMARTSLSEQTIGAINKLSGVIMIFFGIKYLSQIMLNICHMF